MGQFELISSSKGKKKLRAESEEEIKEWVGTIKVVQYYFKVKSDYNMDADQEEENDENADQNVVDSENEEKYDDDKEEEKEKEEEIVEPEEVETDPFWLDIKNKFDAMDYKHIKECIPPKDSMNPSDPKNNKWREVLWKTEYGEFELSCLAQLVCYDTGKWNDDENNILFASISKYGLNSMASWEKIADNLNRSVKDVMKKYSKLVGTPVKQLKKMAVARG